jgi:hypothetical protein
MDAVIAQLVRFSNPSKLVYVAACYGNYIQDHIHHLACFAGGMFALGVYLFKFIIMHILLNMYFYSFSFNPIIHNQVHIYFIVFLYI